MSDRHSLAVRAAIDALGVEQRSPANTEPGRAVVDIVYRHIGDRDDAGVLKDAISARFLFGARKYGTILFAHNGRSAAADLDQEIADACFYAAQLRAEGKEPSVIFRSLLGLLMSIVEGDDG